MRFTWDDGKKQANLVKHGIRFEEAQTVFDDPLSISVVDIEHSIYEERWQTIGFSSSGRLLLVVHIYGVLNDNEEIRIISARKATYRERQDHEKNF